MEHHNFLSSLCPDHNYFALPSTDAIKQSLHLLNSTALFDCSAVMMTLVIIAVSSLFTSISAAKA